MTSNEPTDTFLSGEEMENALGIPTLGHIPRIDEDNRRLLREAGAFSPLTESFRSLRTQLRFVTEQPLRSLLIASSLPGEGKSGVVANLATALAMDGKRVIIVDADLRRPSQHRLHKLDLSPGLTEVLAGTHPLDAALRPTTISGVSLLPAGSPVSHPTEMLGSDAFKRLLGDLGERYDSVLLDSSPVLPVTDAQLLAPLVCGVLVVVGAGDTKPSAVRTTLKLMGRTRASILGTVLNRIDSPAQGGYGTYEYVPTAEPGDTARPI